MLEPVLDPFHRALEFARGERNQEIFRVELAAHTEPAANIEFHEVDGLFRHLQHRGEHAAVEERHLGRTVDDKSPLASIPFGDHAARLQRHGGVAVSAEKLAPRIVGAGEDRVRVAEANRISSCDIAAVLLEQQAGVGLGGAPVRNRSKRLDSHVDFRRGILTNGPAVRQDDRQGLADIAHFFYGDDRLQVFLEAGNGCKPYGNAWDRRADIRRGDHGVDARHLQCRGGIDAGDAPMRHRAAQDRCVQQTGRLVVVDESASSGEETEIFGALHLLADIDIAGGTHCVASRFGLYAARASSTASTICT